MTTERRPFREYIYNEDGVPIEMKVNFHAGQLRAMTSMARIICVLSGAQGGKTATIPHWMYNEIFGWENKDLRVKIEGRGPGDYLIVSATFPLMNNNMLPNFREVFETYYNLGKYYPGKNTFESYEKHHGGPYFRVIFGSAANPESIESATAKAAALDEAGQDQFSLQSWEAIQRRVARNMGRVLITTTIYNLSWLKTKVYDEWLRGDPTIDVIQFPSYMNPTFSRDEFERLRRSMPDWKFKMFYEGKYTKPANLVYDAFDESTQVVPRFEIPKSWPCYVGHDFGPKNTAAVWIAQNPDTGDFYVYRDYLGGELSVEHYVELWKEMSGDERIVKRCGGAQNEEGWRSAFSQAGWPIVKPRWKDVEVGIARVYGLHKTNSLYTFSDMDGYIDEKLSYQYELDDNYSYTGEILRKKMFHRMDAERYILSEFRPDIPKETGHKNIIPVRVY
jgi:hypothetical protein